MPVQMQQFRVVGVHNATGEDVSVVIDAATKAAAEVKAEQMDIETTHIVRLKPDEPVPPDEHELFSAEAAEALSGCRTVNLIEEVVQPEQAMSSRPAPAIETPATHHQAKTQDKSNEIVTAITRPIYAAPASQRDHTPQTISGARAFSFILLVLLGISAWAYFVLVHEPNKVTASEHELVFGEDLFSDVIATDTASNAAVPMRDAFGNSKQTPRPSPFQRPDDPATQPNPNTNLQLQSVVTSHEGRFAVINGKLYKQGATIAGHQLVSVADDWVLMEKGGKQFTLQIEANSK